MLANQIMQSSKRLLLAPRSKVFNYIDLNEHLEQTEGDYHSERYDTLKIKNQKNGYLFDCWSTNYV